MSFRHNMSKDYFALYESPNIVIVPTVTSTTRKDLHPTTIGAAVTESSLIQQILTEEPETFNLFVTDRHVPTSVGGIRNISCVDTSTHFDNLKNLPLRPSIQNEVMVSYSKYSSHNNLVDLTCSNNLNTNETPSKSISNLNINQIIDNGEDKKPIEQKEWGLYHISRVQDNNIYYNSLVTETYPNTVTNNNMNPITESNSTEKELKLINKHEKGNSGSTISQSPKKRSYHESNSENSKKQEDEKEVGLKQRKVLNPVFINKKNDSDQQSIHNKPEYISKHNLNSTKSASTAHKIDQKNERESTSPNKEFLHVTLSEAQKSKLTAGALKRYLDYQRFLAKYYNTFDKKQCGDEKNTNTCNKDLKLSEKRINNNSLKPKHENMKTGNTVERKHEKSNVKTNVERIKNSSRDSAKKSNVEQKQNKEESKRKRYEDKRESNEQSTSRNDRKNKEEDYNEKSMNRMEKKEELKIKFTSYCQKKKKKSIEGLDRNKIETDKRYAQCSDRKTKKKHDEVIDSSKDKKQKDETIRKSYDHSEIKRIKEETKRKSNKTKETGLKRKITDSEPKGVKKYYKRDSASVIGSCQSNSDIESRTLPKRTVDVKEKATFLNSCKDKKDLRSKLSRKITKSQHNTESTRFKLTPTRENLIVTVKQDVLAASSSANVQSVSKEEIKNSKAKKNVQTVNKKEIKKPKVKKSKKIKLVINIKCPNSEDSDGIASETSTSPHPDLSFLDDLDIDGIVDSLNAGQSPIHSNVDVEDLNTADNISPGPLDKDCPHVALHEPDLLRNTRKLKERSIANADKSLLSTPHTNENIVEECNDDIYEVINITDDSDLEDVEESTTNSTQDMSIIYIDDDSRDEAESTNELKNENKVVVISENTENVQNIVAEKNKLNVTNVTDIVDNKTKLPDVKYLITQTASVDSSARIDAVETKYPVQEVSKIKDSNIKINSNTEGDKTFGNNRRIKSENLEEPLTASNVRELMSNDVQNTSKTIKNEKVDGIIVKTEDIEKSHKVLIPSLSIQARMNNNIANTIVNTKTEPIENLEEPQNVATSNSNVREQICNGVDRLKNIKKEQIDVIVKTEEKYQNDLTTSSNIHKHNEVTNTINKPIANMHTAITIKSEKSSVPVPPNIDDINLVKVMTAENVEIIKESSLIVKISEDRVIKQNSTSREVNPKKHSAEITVANKNKSKDSEKLEVKNTKKQAKPGDAIITKSILSTSSNIQEHNTKHGVDNTALNIITERKVKESSSMMKTSEDKAVHVKPNSASSMRECDGNLNKHNAEINVASKNKPNDSEKLEAKNTKKHVKPGDVIIPKSILTTAIIKSKNSSVPLQPNTDDVNLANVMTAENVEIKESSSIMKKSEDKVIKPNSASSKTEENPSKHSAETTIANNNKPKGSEKLEAKNTKKQAKPGDVIISKSKIEKINPVSANLNTKNNILSIYTNDKLKKNIAKVLKKKIPKKEKPAKTEVGVIPIKSEAKDIVYWNKIEQRMFEYLQRNFSLIKLIHKGYFSSIYTCKDDKGGIYAIKILKRKFQSMAIYKDKMLMDLQKSTNKERYFLLRMINNFNIHGEWCFLSEYYPKTLEETLAQGKKKNTICFHIDVVQNLSRQLVAAVCTLTSNLLVHSDIKPAHILLNSSHTRLKLCGFDRMDYNYNIKIIPSTSTASYRAPEIIMGFEADYKIDVWSTALVMFEMASGFKLFPGCFNNDILFKQICTLGPMPYDMIENSSLAFIYFYGTKFMKQIGTSDWVFVPFTDENYRVHRGPYNSYHKTWAPSRSHLQITEDLDKIEMLHRLLQIMLVLDPRHRIPITYVAANEFIFHNDMIPY